MELRHLRYFVAVGQALNFTKAAMRLHLAEPALSRQVSDLEDEFGVDLLKRTSHGVVLTAEGKLFLEATRGVDIQTICADCIQRRKNRSLITNELLSRSITSLASSASTAR
jgi:hypothetical protein